MSKLANANWAPDGATALSLLQEYERSGQGWFWSTDTAGAIVYLSATMSDMLGVPMQELIGKPFADLFDQDIAAEDAGERTLLLMLNTHKTFSDKVVRARGVNEEIWLGISGRPQFSANGAFTGYLGNGTDITASRRDLRDASRAAQFDPLTGLANRRLMDQKVEAAMRLSQMGGRHCALLMFDLDRFKQVNDTFGHPVGDALLKQVAERISHVVDGDHEIGRLGGDEFQILLPDMDDRGALGDIARKLIWIISQPYSINENRCIIGASVGIAIAPFDGADASDLVRNADLALYAAKRGGRGQFRFYGAELHAEAERRKQIEEDLRDALACGQMSLVYQPRIEIATNKVVSLEARIRWDHPDLGEVNPNVFLPIAEESGLLGALDEWAIRRACDDVVQLPGNVRATVSVSAQQLGSLGMLDVVTQALGKSELAPYRLELAFSEAVLAGAGKHLADVFDALKILGVRLVLDDYGAGQSSLADLRECPFDLLKIAGKFTEGIIDDEGHDYAIVKAIISLAAPLGMQTAASDVEAQDQLASMQALGVTQVHGGIYADCVAFADVVDALSSGAWVIEPSGPSRYRSERRTVFRRVGLIHDDYRYEVMMRNLSRTGCMLDGLLTVPVDTQFVVDFGDGQLAVGTVRRSAGSLVALEFELPLVDDGAGGLVTRNRVSREALHAAGIVPTGGPGGSYPMKLASHLAGGAISMPKFAQVGETSRKVAVAGATTS